MKALNKEQIVQVSDTTMLTKEKMLVPKKQWQIHYLLNYKSVKTQYSTSGMKWQPKTQSEEIETESLSRFCFCFERMESIGVKKGWLWGIDWT